MSMVSCQLFEGITSAECERMFVCFGAREKTYASGEVICEFTGGSKAVGVLLSGSADLVRLDVDGDRVILETMEEGGVFGEVFAFSGSNGDSVEGLGFDLAQGEPAHEISGAGAGVALGEFDLPGLQPPRRVLQIQIHPV